MVASSTDNISIVTAAIIVICTFRTLVIRIIVTAATIAV
jgi:hypothetical protein